MLQYKIVQFFFLWAVYQWILSTKQFTDVSALKWAVLPFGYREKETVAAKSQEEVKWTTEEIQQRV